MSVSRYYHEVSETSVKVYNSYSNHSIEGKRIVVEIDKTTM